MAWQEFPCILGRNINPKTGYSQTSIRVGDVTICVGSHVLAYRLFKGAFSSTKELDHLCRNRGCIQPEHPGTGVHKTPESKGVDWPKL